MRKQPCIRIGDDNYNQMDLVRPVEIPDDEISIELKEL